MLAQPAARWLRRKCALELTCGDVPVHYQHLPERRTVGERIGRRILVWGLDPPQRFSRKLCDAEVADGPQSHYGVDRVREKDSQRHAGRECPPEGTAHG